MRSLYEELGVERSASAEEIKAAYRKRAQETHPDRGGVREEFQRVKHAYDVVSDQHSRRRYDDFEDDGRGDVPSVEKLAQGAFHACVQSGWSAGEDLVKRTRETVRARIEAVVLELHGLREEMRRLERYGRRLKRNRGEPVLEAVIANLLAPVQEQLRRVEVFRVRLDGALELLDGYEFDEGSVAIEARPRRRKRRRGDVVESEVAA